jgi:hypothetical protein
MHRSKQKTSIYHRPYNVINSVIEFIDKSSVKIDACVDYTLPSLIVDNDGMLRSSYWNQHGLKLGIDR